MITESLLSMGIDPVYYAVVVLILVIAMVVAMAFNL